MSKINNLPDILPVFPLSNFIFFPNTSAPLNIFEPRYIQMINESIKSNRVIGMAQPKGMVDPKNQNFLRLGAWVKFQVLMKQMTAGM